MLAVGVGSMLGRQNVGGMELILLLVIDGVRRLAVFQGLWHSGPRIVRVGDTHLLHLNSTKSNYDTATLCIQQMLETQQER